MFKLYLYGIEIPRKYLGSFSNAEFKLYLYEIEISANRLTGDGEGMFKLYLYGIEIAEVMNAYIPTLVQIVPLWN